MLCFVDLYPCIISQIIQVGAQFCLIYLFLFSTCFGRPCAHHQENITVSMRHWHLSLCMGGVWSADQTPPIQSDMCQCRIDTVIFSWWWAHGRPKHVEKRNKYIKQNCAPTWIICETIKLHCAICLRGIHRDFEVSLLVHFAFVGWGPFCPRELQTDSALLLWVFWVSSLHN